MTEAEATENAAEQAAPDAGAAPEKTMKLGDRLVQMGLISEDQLHVALREQRRMPGQKMGELLVDLGFITDGALSEVLAESSGFDQFAPDKVVIDPELLGMIPKDVAARFRVFPVSFDKTILRLAMADMYDVMAIDQIKRLFPRETRIEPLVCSDADIQQVIDTFYGYELSLDGILKELDRGHHPGRGGEDITVERFDATVEDQLHPVVRLVNAILLDAVKANASDLHFEPEGNFLRLRYRIDGVMMQIKTIHRDHWPAISHRLKIMSSMNIADRLNPQDGRTSMDVDNRVIDFRVSSFPTVHGENIVLRVLDQRSMRRSLYDLGFSNQNLRLLQTLLKRPEGIFIVTGPTGSGKTTTLYAMLGHINSLDINIMTMEDPIEYQMPLVRQAQVREGTDMTFSGGIRAMLRQDPDVILVGEVRDSETASMALRASMTGHQVYTTLHTNDAAGALPRLIDLGMRPALMAGNIIGIIAQRLARCLCPECKEMQTATEEECTLLGLDYGHAHELGRAIGCDHCRYTGYRGRIALCEILPINDTMDELVAKGATLREIRHEATKFGFIPMVMDGKDKLLKGIISLESMQKAVDVTSLLMDGQTAGFQSDPPAGGPL